MTVRENSILAYNQIKNNGLLTGRMFDVYDILYTSGPLTSLQANEIYVTTYRANDNLNQFRATITHLKKRGVVKEVGDTTCHVTGMKVALFDVTDGLPTAPEEMSRADRKALLLERITELGKSLPEEHRDGLREIWRIAKGL